LGAGCAFQGCVPKAGALLLQLRDLRLCLLQRLLEQQRPLHYEVSGVRLLGKCSGDQRLSVAILNC
jgi:hypothetical protein